MYSFKISYVKNNKVEDYETKFITDAIALSVLEKVNNLLSLLTPGQLDYLTFDKNIVTQFKLYCNEQSDLPIIDVISEILEINPEYLIQDSCIVDTIEDINEHISHSKSFPVNQSTEYKVLEKKLDDEIYAIDTKTNEIYKIGFYDYQRECFILHRSFVGCKIINKQTSTLGPIYNSKRDYDEHPNNKGWMNRKIYSLYFNEEKHAFNIDNYPHHIKNEKDLIEFMRHIINLIKEIFPLYTEKPISSIKIEIYTPNLSPKKTDSERTQIYLFDNNKQYKLIKTYYLEEQDIEELVKLIDNKTLV